MHSLRIISIFISQDVRIDVLGVKNIIISSDTIGTTNGIDKLYLSSPNAVTCRIVDTEIYNLIANLPHCPKIIKLKSDIRYNPNTF
jgi:hypothetical protein